MYFQRNLSESWQSSVKQTLITYYQRIVVIYDRICYRYAGRVRGNSEINLNNYISNKNEALTNVNLITESN